MTRNVKFGLEDLIVFKDSNEGLGAGRKPNQGENERDT